MGDDVAGSSSRMRRSWGRSAPGRFAMKAAPAQRSPGARSVLSWGPPVRGAPTWRMGNRNDWPFLRAGAILADWRIAAASSLANAYGLDPASAGRQSCCGDDRGAPSRSRADRAGCAVLLRLAQVAHGLVDGCSPPEMRPMPRVPNTPCGERGDAAGVRGTRSRRRGDVMFDYVVVGAGSAGCVVAARLARIPTFGWR